MSSNSFVQTVQKEISKAVLLPFSITQVKLLHEKKKKQ